MISPVFVIIALLVALGPLATDMYLPSLPSLGQALNATTSEVQLTLSIYMVGFALGQIIYGPLSDRYGRKPVLIVGLLLFSVSTAIAVFASNIEVLISARLIQAIGGAAGPVLGRAMVRDLCRPEDAGRVLSNIASAMALAPAVAPVFGGYLTVWFGWQSIFVFLLVFGICLLILLQKFVAETLANPSLDAINPHRILQNYATLLKHRAWRWNTLACSAIFAGLFAYLSGSAFVLIEFLGVNEKTYGLLFTFVVAGFIVGTRLAAKLEHVVGRSRLILWGSLLSFLSGVIMVLLAIAGWHSVYSVVVPQFFFVAGTGIVMPLAMAGALIPFPHMAGAASALLGVIQMSLAAVWGIGVGHLHSGSALVMSLGVASAGVLALVAAVRLNMMDVNQTETQRP